MTMAADDLREQALEMRFDQIRESIIDPRNETMELIRQYATEARREGAREGWDECSTATAIKQRECGHGIVLNPYATPPSAPGGKS